MNHYFEEAKKPRRRIRKAKGRVRNPGGAWKVAYADFAMAMMAVFLVLWLVSQADLKLKQGIASYFRSPGVFDKAPGGVLSQAKKVTKEPEKPTVKEDEQALFSVAEALQKKVETLPEFSKYKDQIKIEVTDDGLRVQIIDEADRVSFASGSARLTAEAEPILREIAKGICGLPNKINIGGHTDRHVFPSATGYTNWELSTDRANAARRVLESECVKPDQIRRVIGFADTEPMVPDDPYSPANRRISITVLRQNPQDGKESNPGDLPPQAKPVSKTFKLETKPEADETDEKKAAEIKLKNEGKVIVGTPDEIPDKPKTKLDK